MSSKPAGPMLEFGIDSLDGDPFNVLVVINMETALIARTLLDHEEASPTGLTRAMLAKMVEELFDSDDISADLAVV